jgi:hypothetical protein
MNNKINKNNQIFYPDDAPHFPELKDANFLEAIAIEIDGLTSQQAILDTVDGVVGKDADFESKHSRDALGEFEEIGGAKRVFSKVAGKWSGKILDLFPGTPGNPDPRTKTEEWSNLYYAHPAAHQINAFNRKVDAFVAKFPEVGEAVKQWANQLNNLAAQVAAEKAIPKPPSRREVVATERKEKVKALAGLTSMVQEAMSPSRDQFKTVIKEKLTADLAKLESDLKSANWDFNKARPFPKGNEGREAYIKMQGAHQDGVRWVEFRNNSSSRQGERLVMMKGTPDERAALIDDKASQLADDSYQSFTLKLADKIAEAAQGQEVKSVTHAHGGDVWGWSMLKAGLADGREVGLETKQIINVSSLGKLFNQWPTRIAKTEELVEKYAPDQARDDHGMFSAMVEPHTDTPEFKTWFKNSKAVDASGNPQVVYHGSRSDFTEFKTDPQDKTSLFDRLIGSHFAEEPAVSNAFVAGEYAYASDYNINEHHPEESWYRGDDRQLHGDGIPSLTKRGADGRDMVVEPYDVNKHGSIWGMRSRMGDDYSVRMLKPGGMIYPVYLSIQKPLVVPSTGGFDQNDITRAVGAKVFPANKDLFIAATHGMVWNDPNKSAEVWDALQSGKGYDKWKTWDDFTKDYGIGLLDSLDKVAKAKQILSGLGYDGIKYKNTSNSEVHEGQNPWTWIAFHPGQIKSIFNRTPHAENADIGKSDEFESKHPHDKSGEFTSSTTNTGDVRFEFEQASKQAGKYKFETPKLNIMAAMLHARRADALPLVVSESEIQNHIAQGETELWRGVEEKQYASKFKGGPIHISTGVMGSGIYTALGSGGRTYAEDFTNQGRGELMHMSLQKDAKVGDWATVAEQMAVESQKVKMSDPVNRTLYSDVGVFGAASGFDALKSDKLGILLLLNRNKVRVGKESMLAKAIVIGNSGLSRRVAECMDSDRMVGLIQEADSYQRFVEAVAGAMRFQDLPEWVKEEIAEAEMETNGK